MRKWILILCCLQFLTATTCEDSMDDDSNCTAEAKAGLNISVSLDEGTSSIASEGITVVATDGDYTETLIAQNEADPVFSGAYERRGNYTITVSKEGYQTHTSGTIRVMADRCHVIPRNIHVTLLPVPNNKSRID